MSSPAVSSPVVSSPAPAAAKRGRPAKRPASDISSSTDTSVPPPPPSSSTIIPPEINNNNGIAAADAAPKKPRKPRAPKAEPTVAAASIDATPIVSANNDVDGNTSSTAAAATAKPRKPRAPKAVSSTVSNVAAATNVAAPPPAAPQVAVTYSLFGDEHLPFEEQAIDSTAYAKWKAHLESLSCVSQSQFSKAKKSDIKRRKRQLAPAKRTIQRDDLVSTAAKTYERLNKLDASTFASLAGAWLSTYGGPKFPDMYTARQLDDPVNGAAVRAEIYATNSVNATSALVVYDLAKEKGFQPLGIVSERSKKVPGTETLVNVVNVEGGPRVYVGPALPFRNVVKSVFAKASEDTVKVKPQTSLSVTAAGGNPSTTA